MAVVSQDRFHYFHVQTTIKITMGSIAILDRKLPQSYPIYTSVTSMC